MTFSITVIIHETDSKRPNEELKQQLEAKEEHKLQLKSTHFWILGPFFT